MTADNPRHTAGQAASRGGLTSQENGTGTSTSTSAFLSLDPAALAPLDTPPWAQGLYDLLGQVVARQHEFHTSLRGLAADIAQTRLDAALNEACRGPREHNRNALPFDAPLRPLPTAAALPAAWGAGQPLPPLGGHPAQFPPTRRHLMTLSSWDCDQLIAAYGLVAGGSIAARRARIATFVGVSVGSL